MDDCLFCKIIAKEVGARIEFEDQELLAFHDIRPKAPVHLLIVPKKHLASLSAATAEDEGLLGRMMLRAALLAKEKGIDQSGYKVSTNIGDDGGQTIHHLHLHVVGGAPVKVTV